jgi:PAS domain S-box-containing protein
MLTAEDIQRQRRTRTIFERGEQRVAAYAAELPAAVETLTGAHTTDAVFVIDPEYRVVHWDTRMESLTGFAAAEALGRPCHETLSGECEGGGSFYASERSGMQLARAGGTPPGCDVRISTRWGEKRWVGVSTLSVPSSEGPYLVHLVRDAQKTHETLELARGLIRLSSDEKPAAPAPEDVPEISPRQMEVLEMLAAGKSVKEISAELFLSRATVRNHVRSILRALESHSQLEALAKARRLGLLSG